MQKHWYKQYMWHDFSFMWHYLIYVSFSFLWIFILGNTFWNFPQKEESPMEAWEKNNQQKHYLEEIICHNYPRQLKHHLVEICLF